ncbi:hypothetical protein ACEWY4_001590 [Coilia grayii]|uniref:ubiquitinyl hydrolase 1 n=1 Tax=Coilia grayii TaxID=363190 RepID=A0ABD1KTF6_9TELE
MGACCSKQSCVPVLPLCFFHVTPSKPLTRSSSCPAFSPSSTLPSLCLPTSLSHSSPNITFSWSPPAPQPPALDTPLPPSTSESQGEPITISFPSNIQSLGNMGDLQVVRQNTTQTYKKRQMLKKIRRSISTICPEFSGDHQQDAHEFLVFCLIKLKEERASISHLQLTCRCPVENMEFQLLSVYTCNRVLVLHLKTFGDISGTTKSSNPINIPLQLNLSRYNRGVSMGQLIPSTSCEEPQACRLLSSQHTYHVASVVSHLGGSVDSGHYICDVLEGDGSNWLCFNDDMVSRENTDILEERSSTAYLLFYVQSCLHHWAADCLSSLHQHRAATCSRFSCFNHGAATCLTCPNNRAATCSRFSCFNHGAATCLTCLNNRTATCLTVTQARKTATIHRLLVAPLP